MNKYRNTLSKWRFDTSDDSKIPQESADKSCENSVDTHNLDLHPYGKLMKFLCDTCILSSDSQIRSHEFYKDMITDKFIYAPIIFGELISGAMDLQFFIILYDMFGSNPVPPELRGHLPSMRISWIEWAMKYYPNRYHGPTEKYIESGLFCRRKQRNPSINYNVIRHYDVIRQFYKKNLYYSGPST